MKYVQSRNSSIKGRREGISACLFEHGRVKSDEYDKAFNGSYFTTRLHGNMVIYINSKLRFIQEIFLLFFIVRTKFLEKKIDEQIKLTCDDK